MSTFGLISRTVTFAITWIVLTKGVYESWMVGLPTILISLYIDFRLSPSKGDRWSLIGMIVYALFFLKFSFIGGLDVVRRAIHPRLPLNPALIEYPLKLRSLSAQNLFISTVSLLPGTLSVEIREKSLIIHVLDSRRPFKKELDIIQARVAAIFQFDSQIEEPVERNA